MNTRQDPIVQEMTDKICSESPPEMSDAERAARIKMVLKNAPRPTSDVDEEIEKTDAQIDILQAQRQFLDTVWRDYCALSRDDQEFIWFIMNRLTKGNNERG